MNLVLQPPCRVGFRVRCHLCCIVLGQTRALFRHAHRPMSGCPDSVRMRCDGLEIFNNFLLQRCKGSAHVALQFNCFLASRLESCETHLKFQGVAQKLTGVIPAKIVPDLIA